MKKKLLSILLGGTLLVCPAHAAVRHLTAVPSARAVSLEGRQLEVYTIEGRDYIPLDSLEGLPGFQVTYQTGGNAVRISRVNPDGTAVLPADGSRYVPQAGDKIACDDGTVYTITDVSRWNMNAFASGPLGDLPEPACDWSRLPQPELPVAEARRFTVGKQDYLFVRNLYETRRMLYTLYNAIGSNPETWRDGAPVLFPSGKEKVRIQLTIDPGDTPQSFWPFREGEITGPFNSCPPGTYCLEAWDVYKNGVFQRTQYDVCQKI